LAAGAWTPCGRGVLQREQGRGSGVAAGGHTADERWERERTSRMSGWRRDERTTLEAAEWGEGGRGRRERETGWKKAERWRRNAIRKDLSAAHTKMEKNTRMANECELDAPRQEQRCAEHKKDKKRGKIEARWLIHAPGIPQRAILVKEKQTERVKSL